MKIQNIITALTTVLVLSISTLVYGGGNSLSKKSIEGLFTKYFKDYVPIHWVHYAAVGKVDEIEFLSIDGGSISIKEQNGGQLPAPYNSECSDCWSIELHVKGVASSLMGVKNPFNDHVRFMLCASYGEKPRPIFYPDGFAVARMETVAKN